MALTEKQLIAALRRLERNWPKSYWLWVTSDVSLMLEQDSLYSDRHYLLGERKTSL